MVECKTNRNVSSYSLLEAIYVFQHQLDQVYHLKYKISLNNSITKLKLLVHIYSFLLLVLIFKRI